MEPRRWFYGIEDAQEVPIYEEIESLLHLRYLALELDASDLDHLFKDDN